MYGSRWNIFPNILLLWFLSQEGSRPLIYRDISEDISETNLLILFTIVTTFWDKCCMEDNNDYYASPMMMIILCHHF